MLNKDTFYKEINDLLQLHRNRHQERISKGNYGETGEWRIILSYYNGHFAHGIDSQEEFIDALYAEFVDMEKRFEGTGFPAYFDIGPGWYRLVAELNVWLKSISPEYRILQCKSKFAGLRYYLEDYTIDEDSPFNIVSRPLISYAEMISYRTCETCGDNGKYRDGGWVRTLCDECEERRNENSS